MATKRPASDAGATGSGAGPPPAKKLMTQFEPIRIGPIMSAEEMDVKVLQFQNRKLAERIDQRRRAEDELRKRIEQLEQRQTTDDAVLCIVNRYWNQLDEDVRILLQRFDADGADESGKKNESSAVTSFLTLLSQWDRPEIEEKLCQRVEFSKRAIGKLLQAYDRLMQKNEKLWNAIKEKDDESQAESSSSDVKDDVKKEENGETETKEEIKVKMEPVENSEIKKEDNIKIKQEEPEKIEKPFKIQEALREDMDRLMAENKRLQNLVTQFQQTHHELNLKNSELMDNLGEAETQAAELKNQVEELEYNCTTFTHKIEKLDRHLADSTQKLLSIKEGEIKVQGGEEGVSKNKFNELLAELEEQKELSANRLTELEKLQTDHQEALKQIEKLKMDLSTLPEYVIVETTEYKCLQSQFSVLYNESMQIKTQLEECRGQLGTVKNVHLRQIEQMEGDELECQKKLRTEVIQLEDDLSRVRREYDMLRIEFEQTLAANEQTGPINREMRHLISSLKNHNEQLKGEVQRTRKKLKEAQAEINKLKSEISQNSPVDAEKANHVDKCSGSSSHSSPSSGPKGDPETSNIDSKIEDPLVQARKEEEDRESRELIAKERGKGKSDADIIKEARAELKKSQDRERDLKLLLDMYKSHPKDTRDKVQLMNAEKKARQEIEELKAHIRKMQEIERRERRKLAEDDAIRKIKKLEDSIAELQKNLAAQKQEEETLLNEMEVTGQAFEDMQEQNIRLLQQLREKDDANFKLMSERIKSNQIHKLLREEKNVLVEQVMTLHTQVESQNQVVRKLEEKERILQSNLAVVEKELALRQQALDLHKRKAVESSQTAADLKLHLDKYHAQLKESQVLVADKTSALQQQTFKYKRIQEDVAVLRRKVERAKKIEMASSADEVLMEEIKEYKEQLTCPSCKVKKKDAVLTKCFHVFCLECLKTRYETRQRKCPKCNATFGANDYHRIYIE